MLTQKEINIIIFYMENAESKMSDAKLLFDNYSYKTAATCLYYACFYVVTALLIANNIKNVKSHSGTQQMLHLHFIKNGKLPNWIAIHFAQLMNRRNEADYALQTIITIDELEINIPLTEKFIQEIKQHIEY